MARCQIRLEAIAAAYLQEKLAARKFFKYLIAKGVRYVKCNEISIKGKIFIIVDRHQCTFGSVWKET